MIKNGFLPFHIIIHPFDRKSNGKNVRNKGKVPNTCHSAGGGGISV